MQKNMIKKMLLMSLLGCSSAVMRPAAAPNNGMSAEEFYNLPFEMQNIAIESLIVQEENEENALTYAVENGLEWAIDPLMRRIDKKSRVVVQAGADEDEDLAHAIAVSQIKDEPVAGHQPVPAANVQPEDDLERILRLSREQDGVPVGDENALEVALRMSQKDAAQKDFDQAMNASMDEYDVQERMNRRIRTVQAVIDRLHREKQDAEYQASLAEDQRKAKLKADEQVGRVQAPVQAPAVQAPALVPVQAPAPVALEPQAPELTLAQRRQRMAQAAEERQKGAQKNEPKK